MKKQHAPLGSRGKIRIALMTHTIDGRRAKGTAVVARKYVEALLSRQDRFELTFIHYEKTDDPIYTHGVREVIFPEIRPRFFNRRSMRQTWYFLTTKDQYDIFVWFQPRVFPFFWKAPAKHLIIAVHDIDISRVEHFDFMREFFFHLLRIFRNKVAIAIAASEHARRDIMATYKFSPERVRAIANGVETTFAPVEASLIARVREKYALPEQYFLNVARLNPGKNALGVMRAFEKFALEHPGHAIHLVNVGANGTEKDLVDAFLAQSPVRDRIHLIKYVDTEDFAAVYGAAFALVFPLLNDGFGLPLLEAMACGTPTIISKTARPEITDNDAILVDAYSIESIANGMLKMLEDTSLREKLIQRGFEKARKYSWDATGRKFIAICEELTARRQP
jgi:glycosyltransferase involved in cell wall biosynthesis